MAPRLVRLSSTPPTPILEAWRRLIGTRDPVAVCQYAVSCELEQRVLPALPEPGADYQLYARALTRPLVEQAVAKLQHRPPADATGGVRALIRARPDQAYQVCTEAIAWVTTRSRSTCANTRTTGSRSGPVASTR